MCTKLALGAAVTLRQLIVAHAALTAFCPPNRIFEPSEFSFRRGSNPLRHRCKSLNENFQDQIHVISSSKGAVAPLHANSEPVTEIISGVVSSEELPALPIPLNDIVSDLNDENEPRSDSSLQLWGMPLQSIIFLNLVAIIWGTQHAVIKSAVDDSSVGLLIGLEEWARGVIGSNRDGVSVGMMDGLIRGDTDAGAAYFTLARFGLAALLASPFTPSINTPRDKNKQNGQNINETRDNVSIEMIGYSIDNKEKHQTMISQRENSIATVNGNEISPSWRYGIELGIYMFLGYGFQAIGLETISASRSGFLLYLNVKLVPFFSYLIFGKRIRLATWISALVAFAGTVLLSMDHTNGGSSNSNGEWMISLGLTAGDLWSIAAAASSAMFIIRMENASKVVSKSSELNAANLWTVAVLSFIWSVVISWESVSILLKDKTVSGLLIDAFGRTIECTLSTIDAHPLQLLYLAVVPTVLSNYIQSKASKGVSAERASIIYAMDPVYGAIFANILLGEELNPISWIGAGLIVAAAATSAIWDLERVENPNAVD